MTAVANMENDMRSKIMAIMQDKTMTDEEKARKRQDLLMGRWSKPADGEDTKKEVATKGKQQDCTTADGGCSSGSLDENLKCGICLSMCERPVTAPCQHNFCLGCFKKWTYQGKKTCPTCRAPFPSKFAQNPRINTALTFAIRLAKNPVKTDAGPPKDYKRINNETRPDEAFVTDRAVRAGRANAASGRIMVTIPNDHFGPIGPEHDPIRNQGVLVGEWWKDRLDCRQWGAHFPHVAGISGQSSVGSQSVVLSGGYEDDRDEGEWFLYTGSGGRDLSGNKRTNKVQSFDQEFENMNKALKLSCTKGLPVRVVRSFKEKRSSYAPTSDTPVRYDGVYRILRCWRKAGQQSHLMCRYLFVRCDNSPAPWSSGDTGDSERMEIPKEAMEEIKQAKGQVFEMSDKPIWAWLESEQRWGFSAPPPASQKSAGGSRPANPEKKLKKKLSEHEKALKEFKCEACHGTLKEPLNTPCGHNFCRGCLHKKFEGIEDIQAPNGARTLRVRRNLKPCPTCKADLCEFLAGAQVNREMVAVIQKLQDEVARAREEAEKLKAEAGEGEGQAEEAEEGDQDGDMDAVEEDEDCAEAEEEEEEAGPSGTAAAAAEALQAGTSGAAAAAAGQPSAAVAAGGTAGLSAAAPAVLSAPAEQYSRQLVQLTEEFPEADRESIKRFLEEQQGDVMNTRVAIRRAAREAAAAAGSAGPTAAAVMSAPAVPAEQYSAQLLQLTEEFPEVDRELIKCFLEDQGGDVMDVRVMIRKTAREAKPRGKAAAATKPKAKAAAGRKRKQAAADEKEEEGVGEETGVEDKVVEQQAAGKPKAKAAAGRKRKQAAADEKEEEGVGEETGVEDKVVEQQAAGKPKAKAAAGRKRKQAAADEKEEEGVGEETGVEEEVVEEPAAGKAKAAPKPRGKKARAA